MTKLGFVSSSLRHRPGRTALAVGCFALTSVMCASTFTLVTKSTALTGKFPGPRVIVVPYGQSTLTLAHVAAIKGVPRVTDIEYQRVLFFEGPGGQQLLLWSATDGWPATHPSATLSMSEDVERAWRRDRRGIVATHTVADPLHWRPGAAVTMKTEIGEVVGLFDGYVECPVPLAIGHFEHISGASKEPATLSRLSVGCEPGRCQELVRDIDARFEDGASGTFSMTQEDFFRSLTEGAGSSIAQLFALVGLAIIAVTAIVTGSSLSIGFRERMSEFATLRTLGFHRGTIFGLLLAESATCASVGGSLGALPLYLVTRWHPITIAGQGQGDLLSDMAVSGGFTLAAIGAALILGAVVCVFPAIRSLRQSILEGLAD